MTPALVVDLAATPMVDEFVAGDQARRTPPDEILDGVAGEITDRQFTPRRVFDQRGEWYVAGDDHRSGEYRTFRIDRVESIEPTGEFDDPVDDDESPRFIGVVGRRRLAAPRDGSFGPVARWVVEEYPVDSVTEPR